MNDDQKEKQELAEYFKALENIEEHDVPPDFLAKVNERIDSGPWFKRLGRKFFFPVHVKLPIEVAGLAVTAGLLLFIARPYYKQLKEKEIVYPAPVEVAEKAFSDETIKKLRAEKKIEYKRKKKEETRKKALVPQRKMVKAKKAPAKIERDKKVVVADIRGKEMAKPEAKVRPALQAGAGEQAQKFEQRPAGDQVKAQAFASSAAMEEESVLPEETDAPAAPMVQAKRARLISRFEGLTKRRSKPVHKSFAPAARAPEEPPTITLIRSKELSTDIICQKLEQMVISNKGNFSRVPAQKTETSSKAAYTITLSVKSYEKVKSELTKLGTISDAALKKVSKDLETITFKLIVSD
jgi:hypothetical protein